MALLLVRPVSFGFNAETALTNSFQVKTTTAIAEAAQQEFDVFAGKLKAAGIETIVIEDTPQPVKPDAVFPNNWISFHDRKTIVLWPMQAVSRRQEKRMDIVLEMMARGYKELLDYSVHEKENRFLEGTGSIVIDYSNRLAYAALSPRTDGGLLRKVCRRLDYKPVIFRSIPVDGHAVYHTNVLMALQDKLAVLCEDCIDLRDRDMVRRMLEETGHEIMTISMAQLRSFAGNMLFTQSQGGETFCVLSSRAYASLTDAQLATIGRYAQLLHSDIGHIETAGGGSARCMLAELR